MAEIVGTAFVRIRAITAQLSKDVEDSIKKGVADADVDAIGEDTGDEFSEGFSKRLKREIGKQVKDAFDGADRDGRNAGEVLGEAIADGVTESFDLESIGNRFRDDLQIGFADIGDHFKATLTDSLRRSDVQDSVEVEGVSLGRRIANGVRSGISRAARPGSPLSKAYEKLFNRQGSRGGAAFAGGFRGAIIRSLIVLAPTLVAPLAGVVSLITQYVVALVGQIGYLVTAAVGGGVAMGAAFGLAALAIIPIVSALRTETPALKTFQKATERLGKAWEDVGEAAQKGLLPPLTDLVELVEDRLIPVFADYAEVIGDLSGRFITLVTDMIFSERGQERLSRIFTSSIRVFQVLSNTVALFGDAFFTIFAEAGPIAIRFAESVENIASKWNALIQGQADSGELGRNLTIWYDRAALVAGALGDIAVALWNTFTIGADVSTPFFESFAAFAERWREFTASTAGQDRIREVFEGARDVAHEVNLIVTDIFERLWGAATDGENNNLLRVLRSIREDFIPAIDDFLTRFSEQSADALTGLATSLGELFKAMSETGSLSVTAQILSSIADSLAFMVRLPGVGALVGVFVGIASAFKILSLLRIPTIVTWIGKLFLTITGATVGSILLIIAAAIASIAFWLNFVRDRWGEWTSAIALFAGPIGIAAFIIGGIIENFGFLKDVLGEVIGFVKDTAGSFVDFLGPALEGVKDVLGDVVDFLADVGSDIGQGIGTGIMWLWDEVLVPFGNFLTGVFPAIWDGVQRAWSWFTDNVIDPLGTAIQWLRDEVLEPFGEWVGKVLAPLWDAIQDVWRDDIIPIIEDLGAAFDSAKTDYIEPVVAWIQENLIPIWDKVFAAVSNVIAVVQGPLSTAWTWFKDNILAPIVAFLTGDFATAWSAIQTTLGLVAEFIGGIFSEVWTALVTLWEERVSPALTLLKDGFGEIAAAIGFLWTTYLTPVWNFIQTTVIPITIALATTILQILGVAVRIIGGIILWWWQNILSPVWNFISTNFIPIVTALATTISSILGGAVRIIGGLISAWWAIVTSFGSFLRNSFTGAINVVKGAIGFLGGVVSAIANGFRRVWDIVVQIAGYFRGALVSALNVAKGAWSGISGILSGIVGTLRSIWEWARKAIEKISQIKMPSLPGGGLLGGIGGVLGGFNPFAAGGIVNSPTAALIGEAGREVVIPLTRPRRARELAEQSGLYDVLLGRGVSDRGGTSVTVADGAIVINFDGVVPTDTEARNVGRQVGIGLTDVLARRRIQSGARTA